MYIEINSTPMRASTCLIPVRRFYCQRVFNDSDYLSPDMKRNSALLRGSAGVDARTKPTHMFLRGTKNVTCALCPRPFILVSEGGPSIGEDALSCGSTHSMQKRR